MSWAYWIAFQEDLVKLSSNSKHIIVEDAGHAIHVNSPKAGLLQMLLEKWWS